MYTPIHHVNDYYANRSSVFRQLLLFKCIVIEVIMSTRAQTGLDSASSLEILKSLSMLAETGRAVVVTIHQPRSEIFHSFDKILLLCNGQVAFFGSPIKVWDFFTDALDYEDESLVSMCVYVSDMFSNCEYIG